MTRQLEAGEGEKQCKNTIAEAREKGVRRWLGLAEKKEEEGRKEKSERNRMEGKKWKPRGRETETGDGGRETREAREVAAHCRWKCYSAARAG